MTKLTKLSFLAPAAALLMLTAASAQGNMTTGQGNAMTSGQGNAMTSGQGATTGAATQGPMMNGQAIPTEQVPAVRDWCKELQAQQGLTGTQQPESTMTKEQTEAATATQNGATESFDLSSVTLETCQEAGFTDQAGQ